MEVLKTEFAEYGEHADDLAEEVCDFQSIYQSQLLSFVQRDLIARSPDVPFNHTTFSQKH